MIYRGHGGSADPQMADPMAAEKWDRNVASMVMDRKEEINMWNRWTRQTTSRDEMAGVPVRMLPMGTFPPGTTRCTYPVDMPSRRDPLVNPQGTGGLRAQPVWDADPATVQLGTGNMIIVEMGDGGRDMGDVSEYRAIL